MQCEVDEVLGGSVEREMQKKSPHFNIIEILFNLKVYHRHKHKQDIKIFKNADLTFIIQTQTFCVTVTHTSTHQRLKTKKNNVINFNFNPHSDGLKLRIKDSPQEHTHMHTHMCVYTQIHSLTHSSDTHKKFCVAWRGGCVGICCNFYLDKADICSLSCNSSSLCRST